MATTTTTTEIHRHPQPSYTTHPTFLSPTSPFSKPILISHSSTLQLHSLSSSTLSPPLFSHPLPSHPTSISSTPTLLSLSTTSTLYFLSPTTLTPLHSLSSPDFHIGGITGVDVVGEECVSVGDDGRVNLVKVGNDGEVGFRKVFDGDGLVGFECVKWGSNFEFATGGFGFGLHWWDLRRKPGEPALQFKGIQSQKTSGIVHSIDIHPSRKHTCVAGGSAGTVFIWDLRWPQQPIVLSGVGTGDRSVHPVSESEVWKVQFDCHSVSSNIASMSSSRMLPVMMCSEDGILAVLEQGAEPVELLAEPCAINSFDIDKQNYSDIICSLEWESLVVISRS